MKKNLISIVILLFVTAHMSFSQTAEQQKMIEQALEKANKEIEKAKKSNMLILTDSQGIPLTCSGPVEGNHNDAFNLVSAVQKMIAGLGPSEIRTDGLFLNADPGFGTEGFRGYCSEVEIMGNIDQNK